MVMTEAEPWRVPEQSLELLGRVADRIQPDDPTLVEWVGRYRREHLVRLAADLAIIERHIQPDARLLEYGAAPLLLTAAISTLDYRVSALDLEPDRFSGAIARLGLDVRRCDIETESVPFADGTFDAVLFNELFEHLRINPIFTMREVRRVLKPGGSLLLSTPNLRSLRGIRNLLVHSRGASGSTDLYQQYEKLATLGHMGHVREYTAKEIAEFLDRIGFQVDRVVFRGGHGAGLVGGVERLLPSLRPFFTIIATTRLEVRPETPFLTRPDEQFVGSGSDRHR